MKSPFPFKIPSTEKNWDTDKKIKITKALVYDFLKKNRKLEFFYDSYVKYHNPIIPPMELNDMGLRPFEFYLKEAASDAIIKHVPVRDFFFRSNTCFPWNEEIKISMELLDHKWLNLMDNLGK